MLQDLYLTNGVFLEVYIKVMLLNQIGKLKLFFSQVLGLIILMKQAGCCFSIIFIET